MTTTRRRLLILLLAFSLPAAAGADENIQEIRRHFTLDGPDKAVLYEVTEIIRLSDTFDENTLLVHDRDHGQFLMEARTQYSDQIVTYAITDVKRKAFVRSSFRTPFTSRTRVETLQEARRSPQVMSAPAIVTVTTNGGDWASIGTDLNEWSTLRRLRHQIRPTTDPFILEALERMRGSVLALPFGSTFYTMVAIYVLYDAKDPVTVSVRQHDQPPACDFDKSFGYPCSEAQLAMIKKLAEEGSSRTRY